MGMSKPLDPSAFTLLVVDDVDANRDLLTRWLTKRGFRVVAAPDGLAALHLVRTQPIDLVILDVTMPGMSGLDVLRELRATVGAADLPVIMATARSRSEHVVEALDLGANDYVTKPVDFAVLHARVLAALRTASPSRRKATGELGPGAVLAERYELMTKLGEGGFGAVYRARHRELGRPCAVKVLRAPHLGPDGAARFRREGINACLVQHPNALEVIDSGATDEGVAYLVMELLDGHTLEDEVRKGWMSFARLAEVMAPVCDALAAAHDAGIVHRDIKPANIFLHRGPQGLVPKVLDFGIAKLVTAELLEQQITVEGLIVGTPAYMAPERFTSTIYDGRSDVYSVGILLHQLIAGALPFALSGEDAGDAMALAVKHQREAPVPLRQLEPDTPEALEALVLRALAKAPADRPSAGELAAGLRVAIDGAVETRSRMRTHGDLEAGPTIVSGARIRAHVETVSLRATPDDEPT